MITNNLKVIVNSLGFNTPVSRLASVSVFFIFCFSPLPLILKICFTAFLLSIILSNDTIRICKEIIDIPINKIKSIDNYIASIISICFNKPLAQSIAIAIYILIKLCPYDENLGTFACECVLLLVLGQDNVYIGGIQKIFLYCLSLPSYGCLSYLVLFKMSIIIVAVIKLLHFLIFEKEKNLSKIGFTSMSFCLSFILVLTSSMHFDKTQTIVDAFDIIADTYNIGLILQLYSSYNRFFSKLTIGTASFLASLILVIIEKTVELYCKTKCFFKKLKKQLLKSIRKIIQKLYKQKIIILKECTYEDSEKESDMHSQMDCDKKEFERIFNSRPPPRKRWFSFVKNHCYTLQNPIY